MQDRLEVCVKDILTLLNSDLCPENRRELERDIEDLLDWGWKGEDVVEFNEQPDIYDEITLAGLRNIFLEYKMPYVYYSDGNDHDMRDAYYEYYNKDVSERPTKAYYLYSENGFGVSHLFLANHQDEDAETFKQSVIDAITDPFKAYPSLDSLV